MYCLISQNTGCYPSVVKCKVSHIGNTPYTGDYSLDGTQLELLENIRDLGIQVDAKLKFHTHTDIVVKKAYHVLGLICKSFERKDSDITLKLYTTLVRPIVEYNNVLWGPSYILDNQKLKEYSVKQPEWSHLSATCHIMTDWDS